MLSSSLQKNWVCVILWPRDFVKACSWTGVKMAPRDFRCRLIAACGIPWLLLFCPREFRTAWFFVPRDFWRRDYLLHLIIHPRSVGQLLFLGSHKDGWCFTAVIEDGNLKKIVQASQYTVLNLTRAYGMLCSEIPLNHPPAFSDRERLYRFRDVIIMKQLRTLVQTSPFLKDLQS